MRRTRRFCLMDRFNIWPLQLTHFEAEGNPSCCLDCLNPSIWTVDICSLPLSINASPFGTLNILSSAYLHLSSSVSLSYFCPLSRDLSERGEIRPLTFLPRSLSHMFRIRVRGLGLGLGLSSSHKTSLQLHRTPCIPEKIPHNPGNNPNRCNSWAQ